MSTGRFWVVVQFKIGNKWSDKRYDASYATKATATKYAAEKRRDLAHGSKRGSYRVTVEAD